MYSAAGDAGCVPMALPCKSQGYVPGLQTRAATLFESRPGSVESSARV